MLGIGSKKKVEMIRRRLMIEFVIGTILGIVFFGGLYLTVQKLNAVRNPSLLFFISFISRMAIVLGGLYYVSKNGYEGVLIALAGIIFIRFIMLFTINKPREKS